MADDLKPSEGKTDDTKKPEDSTSQKNDESKSDNNSLGIDKLPHDELLKNPHYAGLFKEIEETRKAKKDAQSQAELAEIEAQKKKGEYEEVIKKLETKASRADTLETTLSGILEKEKASIPEENRSLVPESLSVEQQLEYITTNRERLVGKPSSKAGNPTNPPTDVSNSDDTGDLLPLSKVKDPEYFAANRDKVLKAIQEGKIDQTR